MPSEYGCTSRPDRMAAGLAKSLAITGPGTLFPGAMPAKGLERAADAGVIVCAEVGNLDVPWTAPIDLDVRTMSFRFDDRRRPGLSSPHPAGVGVLSGPGCANRVTRDLTTDQIRKRLTIPGHESITPRRKSEEAAAGSRFDAQSSAPKR